MNFLRRPKPDRNTPAPTTKDAAVLELQLERALANARQKNEELGQRALDLRTRVVDEMLAGIMQDRGR